MADSRKDVELRIRATDQTGGAAASAAGNVDKVTGALNRQAAASRKAADSSAQLYNKLSDQLQTAQTKAVESRQTFELLRDVLDSTADATRKEQRELAKLEQDADRADTKVTQLTAALEKADAAFRRQVAKAQQSSDEAGYVGALTIEIEKAEAAQERLARLNAFRQVGQQATEAARDLGVFDNAVDKNAASANRFSTSLLAIIDPAQAARNTLDGLASEVQRVVAVVGDADKPIREYQEAINDLGRIQSSILKQGAAIDAYRQQEEAVDKARRAFENARTDVLRYAQAVEVADEPNADLAASLARAEASLQAANRELDQQRGKLNALRAPLDAAEISTLDLAKAEERLKRAANDTSIAVGKLDKAMSGQGTRTGRFLGLKPYEIQNLGFQINDVFTQLASGASVTQTFAQQGGQILQIFPGLFAQIVRFIPLLALVGVTAGTAILSIKRVLDQREAIKDFQSDLALNADQGMFSPTILAAQADALDKFGASAKEAREELKIFIAEGVDPTQFESFGRTAQNVADVLKKELPEAARSVAEAFTGGFEAVRKLDEQMNFLTATELEHIRVLFEDGKAQEARTEAYRLFQRRAQEAADLQNGPWKEAARNFGGAWSTLLDRIGNTRPIQDAINLLNVLATTVRGITKLLPGGNTAAATGSAADLAVRKAEENIRRLEQLRKDQTADTLLGKVGNFLIKPRADVGDIDKELAKQRGIVAAGRKQQVDATEAQKKAEAGLIRTYDDQEKSLAGLTTAEKLLRAQRRIALVEEKARAEASAKGLNNAAIERVAAVARAAELAKINKEVAKDNESQLKKQQAAARKGEAAARKAEAEARAAENRRQSLEGQLLNDMRAMDVKIAKQQKTSLEDRLSAIDTGYAKIFDTLEKFESAGGREVDGQDLTAFRAKVESNKVLLKQQEQLAFYEDAINEIEKERDARLDSIVDKQAAGILTSAQAFQEAKAVQDDLGPKISQMADDAIKFAEAIGGTNPSPQLQAFLAAMRSSGGTTGREVRQTGKALAADEERALNAILAERNALVEANNELVQAGLLSNEEARRRNEEAYNSAAPLIQAQIDKFKELLSLLVQQGVITQQVYDAWIAKLALVGQQTNYVDAQFVEMKNAIDAQFVNGGIQLFDALTDTLGGLADGTLSFKDAIKSAGNAFRQFAADFLRMIAQMIIKQLILNAISSASGQGGVGGAIASFFKVGHIGMIAGQVGGVKRKDVAANWNNAPRYHMGSPGVGLAADEQRAILRKGEEVLTEDNPRHVKNWSGGNAAPVVQLGDTKIINTLDPGEFISMGLASREGEKAMLNFIRANPNAFRNAGG